jgi:uncharacterized protein (UPF0332 family)
LAEGGFDAQAISRAYHVTFYAAEAALLAVGETRSRHSGVISAFAEIIVRRHGFDPEVARLIRPLFELRTRIDYDPPDVPPGEAKAAIRDAERFVEAVRAWLSPRETRP